MFTKATFSLQLPNGEPYTHAIQPNGELVVLRSPQGLTHMLTVLIRQAGLRYATKEQLLMVSAISQLLVDKNPAVELVYKAGTNPLAKTVPFDDSRQLHLFRPPSST